MKYVFSLVLLFSVSALGKIQLFLPGLQMRFQDTLNQKREMVFYHNYSVNYTVQSYLVSLEYNRLSEASGNSSLNVESQIDELLMIGGYRVYTWIVDRSAAKIFENKYTEQKINIDDYTHFDFYLHTVYGKSQTRVRTYLLGTSSTQKTDWDDVMGLGAAVQLKIGYFVASLSSHYLQSKGFSPNFVPATTLKIGLEF